MNEDKLRSEIERGVRAQAIANDEMLLEAFASMEEQYMDNWRNQTKPADTAVREKLWQAIKVVQFVRQHLIAVVSNGSVAQRQLDALIDKQRRVMGMRIPF